MAAQQQKQNYQRILEHTLEEIGKNGAVSDSFTPQLLRSLQQLCIGVSVTVF